MLVPSPDSGIVNVGLDPFDETTTLPVTLPAVFGAKETLNVVLWAAFNIIAPLKPLT